MALMALMALMAGRYRGQAAMSTPGNGHPCMACKKRVKPDVAPRLEGLCHVFPRVVLRVSRTPPLSYPPVHPAGLCADTPVDDISTSGPAFYGREAGAANEWTDSTGRAQDAKLTVTSIRPLAAVCCGLVAAVLERLTEPIQCHVHLLACL
ncbi:hypothetical protein HRG_011067 [Hirsutella rhossiliensis]|uniref:Uncharacterized protein n=1 Tax=Hirsutella rhossiliensis TaxID=111463 RepID=A0A9P8MP55_9HYPO|nr:uncharacterized protein HRG_11067 [Hirsutella rhossiliensis]KAH0957974.1 hypothetical protein HRG_11067 [Hirsutella rhossiliensis]